MTADVDVVVTDGFTGNVALKTLEGGHAGPGRRRARRRSSTDEASRGAADVLLPALLPLYADARPRHHRRRDAARRRRRVHHQPRLVVGHGHGQRHRGWPREMVEAGVVDRLRRGGRRAG